MRPLRGFVIGILLACGVLAGCAPSEEETQYLAKKAYLERQNRGIRELIAEEEKGSLVPSDRFLIGIDEQVIGDLFRSELPLDRPLGKQFIVHLESARISLQDKYGAITIEGDVHRRATPDRKNAVRIFGGLGAVEIDSTTDRLGLKIAIDHLELVQAGLLDQVLGPGGKKLLAEKGRGLLEDALPTLQIPVGLGQKIRVPAIQQGPIQLDSLVVPLHLSVERVIAAGGKLWVTLDADIGKVTGAEEGLGVAVKKKPKRPGIPVKAQAGGGK